MSGPLPHRGGGDAELGEDAQPLLPTGGDGQPTSRRGVARPLLPGCPRGPGEGRPARRGAGRPRVEVEGLGRLLPSRLWTVSAAAGAAALAALLGLHAARRLGGVPPGVASAPHAEGSLLGAAGGGGDAAGAAGSLVGWWRFDDPVGTRHWRDDSPLENRLVSLRPGGFQHAFAEAIPGSGLDGTPGIRFWSRSAAQAQGVPWFRTVSFWEKRDAGVGRISKWLSATTDAQGKTSEVFSLDVGSNSQLSVWFADASGKRKATVSMPFEEGDGKTWQHVAVVLSEDKLTLYLNGEEQKSVQHQVPDITGFNVSLQLGTGEAQNQFLGTMDELRLYSLPLAPESIAALAATEASDGVVAGENVPPVADAGPPLTLWKPWKETALGGGCTDPDGGPEPVQAAWKVLSGPDVSALHLADASVANTEVSFSPEAPLGDYVLQLDCSDGLQSRSSTVKIVLFAGPDVGAEVASARRLQSPPVAYWVDDGCHSEEAPSDDVEGSFVLAENAAAAPRCCNAEGTSCTTPLGCPSFLVFEDASALCVSKGRRLCTKDELLSEVCCGTGGNCDNYAVWTSTAESAAPAPATASTTESAAPAPATTSTTESAAPTTTSTAPAPAGGQDGADGADANEDLAGCVGQPRWGFPAEGAPVIPVGLWLFDDEAESLKNSALQGKDATLVAIRGQGDLAEFVKEGVFGGALHLKCDSNNECGQLDLGNPEPAGSPWPAMSVSLWFKTSGNNRLTFVTKGAFKMRQLRMPDDTWHHFVVTADNNAQKAYLDGQMLYLDSGVPNRTGSDAKDRLTLGIRPGTGWGEGFDGLLDDLAVFDFLLSNEEVERLRAAGALAFKQRGLMNPLWRGSYNKTALDTYFPDLPEKPDYDGFVLGAAPPKESPPAYEHPRVLFTQGQLPALRERLRNTTGGRVAMENIRSLLEAEWPAEEMAKGSVKPGDLNGQLLIFQSFRTLIDADREMASVLEDYLTRYADELQPILEAQLAEKRSAPWSMGKTNFDSTNTWKDVSQSVLDRGVVDALSYDFLYPYLSDSTRAKLRKLIATGTGCSWSIGMDAVEALPALTSNWLPWVTGDMILTILSIEGETGFDQGVYTRAALAYRGWVTLGISELSGATFEGGGKNSVTAPKFMALALHGYPQYMAMPGLRKFATQFLLHTMLPNGNVVKDDMWGSIEEAPPLMDVATLKYAFPKDEVVDWVYRNAVTGSTAASRFRNDSMPYHAWAPSRVTDPYEYNNFVTGLVYAGDWDGPADWAAHAASATSAQPLTYVAEDRGMLVTRSAWADIDAAWLWFNVRSLPGGHAARARGEFCFYALGEIWAWYVTGHNEDSDLHSVVLVDGKGMAEKVPGRFMQFRDSPQATFGTMDAADAYGTEQSGGSWGSKAPNSYTVKPLPYKWGDVAWADLPNWWSGAAADLEGSQGRISRAPPGNFSKAFRTVGLVRSASNPYALVLDDIQMDDSPHTFSWRMQLRKTFPVFDPASGLESFDTESRDYFKPDGNDFVLRQSGGGDARLLVRLLEGSTPYKSVKITSDDPDRYECLQVEAEATSARFRLLLYAFRGDEKSSLPATSWQQDQGILRIGGDEIKLRETAEGATVVESVSVAAGGSVELTSDAIYQADDAGSEL